MREMKSDILADRLGWHALNQRRVIHNAAPPVHNGGQFLQRSQARITARLHDPVLRVLLLFRGGQHAGDVVDRQMGVPGREIAQSGESVHRFAVRGDRAEGGRPALRGSELVCACCDDEAGGQALDIPFERTGQRLIEVVDIEHEGSFRRPIHTEIGQVGVTAQLHGQAACRDGRQIHSHDGGAAAVEREGRGQHAAVADAYEIGEPVGGLRLQDADRITSVRWRTPTARGLRVAGPCG